MFSYFSCGLSRLPHITVTGAAHRFSEEDVGTNLFPSQPESGHKAALFLAFYWDQLCNCLFLYYVCGTCSLKIENEAKLITPSKSSNATTLNILTYLVMSIDILYLFNDLYQFVTISQYFNLALFFRNSLLVYFLLLCYIKKFSHLLSLYLVFGM